MDYLTRLLVLLPFALLAGPLLAELWEAWMRRRRKAWYKNMYLTSDHWLRYRADELERHPWCSECGATKCLQVHHRTYRVRGKSVLFREHTIKPHVTMVLCADCHKKLHQLARRHARRKRVRRLTDRLRGKW